MSFSFGSTASQATPFGSSSKPSFSFGSTNTATTSQAGFSGFGTSTTSSGFGSFGSTSTASATPFGGLGSTPASTAPSLFGGTTFGNTAAKPNTGFGTGTFGANTGFGTGTSNFGSTAPSFGTNTFGTGSTFGSTFGKPTTTGFSGFGTGLGTTSAFGQQQQPQQQQQQPQGPTNAHEALVAAVFNCNVFGDERDQVLAKWNLLQAQWGTGQAYYNRNAQPLELNEQNPLCRFKAVGYSRLGGKEDKDGHVAMMFNKPEQEIKSNQQGFITSLAGLLGNKPNLVANIETVKAVSDKKCQVVVYIVDKGAGGCHINASELSSFLNNGAARNTLTSAGCTSITPVTRPTPQMLDQYLQAPPPGMDMRLWKQAQADNPDPENYIPVPIIGFSEIKFRAQCQTSESGLQASYLRKASETLSELRTRRAASAATLAQLTARFHSLRHTLLQVIARQEVLGRVGAALSPEEEASRARLQELATQLAAPPLYNGRLNELLCAVRLQRSASAGAPYERYHLDPGAQEDVKQFLSFQQRGMAHLMDTAKTDLAALNTIAEGMAKLVRA
ncbi:probable nucleoporin Nup54 isoform X1 [Pieris napi]|uniref:probable nucleoporin Nup54 isoform X1 n=1 Tax=Pieris napi TaxID=78633 RepID=UPI001FBBC413|nr:probable nucleoporin Nup54 isoform X1 [Pieris napi]XP_047514284.1 probable nucleoporin Nup54 isoform X1 [Pieris napi]